MIRLTIESFCLLVLWALFKFWIVWLIDWTGVLEYLKAVPFFHCEIAFRVWIFVEDPFGLTLSSAGLRPYHYLWPELLWSVFHEPSTYNFSTPGFIQFGIIGGLVILWALWSPKTSSGSFGTLSIFLIKKKKLGWGRGVDNRVKREKLKKGDLDVSHGKQWFFGRILPVLRVVMIFFLVCQ